MSLRVLAFGLALLLPALIAGQPTSGPRSGSGAAGAPAATGDVPPTPELAQALARVNYWRSQFQAAPLAWNKTVYEAAVAAIAGCPTPNQGPVRTPNYGNIVGYGYESWTVQIDQAVSGVCTYNYNNPAFQPSSGLFTQVVWKGSKTIGCAKKDCPLGSTSICLFSPPGNYIGQFAANVGPKPANFTCP